MCIRDRNKAKWISNYTERDRDLSISDISNIVKGDEVQERIFDAAEANVKAKGIDEDDPRYSEELIIEATRITQEYGKNLQRGFAEGGPVTMTEDVNVMEQTPTGMADVNVSATEPVPTASTNEINISYEQLRDRLPPEISDDIVLLLSQSYEAFADFAEIQTQADVNEFNIKYNVQLFLPQQSGA